MVLPNRTAEYLRSLEKKRDVEIPLTLKKIEEEIEKLKKLHSETLREQRQVQLDIESLLKRKCLLDLPYPVWRIIEQCTIAGQECGILNACLASPKLDEIISQKSPIQRVRLTGEKAFGVLLLNDYLDKDDITSCLNSGSDFSNKKIGQNLFYQDCIFCERTILGHNNRMENRMKTYTNKRPFNCKICDFFFRRKSQLNRHKIINLKERNFDCHRCDKKFGRNVRLRQHVRRVHDGEKNYNCSKRFFSKHELTRHLSCHTKAKNFKCELCEKMFSAAVHLGKHIRTHTKEKPYKCVECKKNFSTSSYLKKHSRIHSGVKPYSCKYCNKSFGHISNMYSHERIHTNKNQHKCDTCGKTFTKLGNKNRHMRIHTGHKPHACLFCRKRFTWKSSLEIHIRKHTKEQPDWCQKCDKRFSHTSSLRHHTIRHH